MKAVGFEPAILEQNLSGDGDHPVELKLRVRASVGGTLRDLARRPVAGLVVQLEGVRLDPQRPAPPTTLVCSDSLGRYVFPGLPPGSYRVSLSSGALDLGHSPLLVVQAGRSTQHDLTVDVQCELTVRVQARGGKPVNGAWVTLSESGSSEAPTWVVPTDQDGRAYGRFLTPGTYELEVHSAGRASSTRELSLEGGAPPLELEVLID